MKLKFLGTSGVLGVPVWNCNCKTCVSSDERNKRLRPSFLIELEGSNVIIDFGKDFYHQLIRYDVKHFDYALVTHAHQDHMDGQEQLTLAGDCILQMPSDVLEKFIERINEKWLMKRNSKLKIKEFKPFSINGFLVDSVKLKHQKDYQGICYPCYGYVFRGAGFAFAYLGDNDEVLEPEKLNNLDLLITDGNRWKDNGWGHAGIEGSLKQWELFKPKRMIITHISHDVEHNEAQEYVRRFGNIDISYDGMEMEV